MGRVKRTSMLWHSVRKLTQEIHLSLVLEASLGNKARRERETGLYFPGLRGHYKCFARRTLLLNIPCVKDQKERVALAHSIHVGVSIRTEAKG